MSEISIQVDGIGKQYRIDRRLERFPTLRDRLSDLVRAPLRRTKRLLRGPDTGVSNRQQTIWALRDVSFTVRRGEVLGVIGRNGSGKSTLLKILARITEPTEGSAALYGQVGTLLDVGTGFHPELSGRENIYLNGAILGIKRADISRKFDAIVDFAEVSTFIDTPMKHYSSGMYIRLAFAVAAHLESDILLTDEVLAVGDIGFQRKCLGKMGEAAKAGRTVLFVSHNLNAVSSLCSRAILLIDGRLECDTDTESALRIYNNSVQFTADMRSLEERNDRTGGEILRLCEVEVLDGNTGQPLELAASGQALIIRLKYRNLTNQPIENVTASIAFQNTSGVLVVACPSSSLGKSFTALPGSGSLTCKIDRLALNRGRFGFNLSLFQDHNLLDGIREAGFLNVMEGDYYGKGSAAVLHSQGVLTDFEWVQTETQD